MWLLTEAVPKRILDLMNVEGLTRENVASHLQVLHQQTCCKKFPCLLTAECVGEEHMYVSYVDQKWLEP